MLASTFSHRFPSVMPPKTAEQKARKKAADAAKKVANKAGAPAASPTPAPEAEAEAPLPTPPTSSSVQTESVASPNSPSPAPSASYANNSASGLLCLPLDSLAYALTFLPAREIGATMISSSYIAKTVLPVFQQKFLISRCKYMLPTPPDTKIHVNESMLHASAVITHAANCGVDLVHKAVSKLNKKILKSSNAGSSSSSAPPPLLSSDPSTGSLSFATYARFLDEAIGGRSSLRIGAGEDDPILPQHTAGRFASCSPEHSVIRAGGGDKKGGGSGIMAWGVGKRGQLGAGKREDNSTPSPVYNGIGFRVRVVQVAAGGGLVRVAHTLLLTDGGRVLSFGCAMYGALGHGFSAGSQLPDEIRPRIIEALLSERVTHVAAGELHSACVTSDGDCYTWGEGFCGQLGQIDKRPSLTPGQVKDELEDEICLSVSCGARHTIVLTEDGEMFSFGLGYFGVLGRSFTPFEFGAKNTGIEQEIEEGEAVEEGAAAASSAPAEAETMGDVLSTATAGLNLSKEQEVNLENLTITLEDSSDQVRRASKHRKNGGPTRSRRRAAERPPRDPLSLVRMCMCVWLTRRGRRARARSRQWRESRWSRSLLDTATTSASTSTAASTRGGRAAGGGWVTATPSSGPFPSASRSCSS